MIGASIIVLNKDEHDALSANGLPFFEGRPIHELARVALLLLAVPHISHEEHIDLIDELFVRGDSAERIALLRAVSLLPDPSRFLATAVEACRANVQTVFEAIACENPYPSCYFPESNFNQLVLKAIFTSVSLQRIVGLSDRVTPALKGMVSDHIKERTAAGRPVHEDVALIMNP
jgi:hypothetical protein